VSDALTRLIRAILPKATPTELAEAAERLGSFIGSGASWVGDTAEHTVRTLGDALLGDGAGSPEPPRLSREEEDRVWERVTGALGPTLDQIERRARALREDADASEAALAVARDVEWLAGELRAAWGREVALRAAATKPFPP
jgi:hypothetical protein